MVSTALIAAFLFTIYVPTFLLLLVTREGDGWAKPFAAMGLYSLAGFFWARWLFLRAQEASVGLLHDVIVIRQRRKPFE